jgi:hypothetical protein
MAADDALKTILSTRSKIVATPAQTKLPADSVSLSRLCAGFHSGQTGKIILKPKRRPADPPLRIAAELEAAGFADGVELCQHFSRASFLLPCGKCSPDTDTSPLTRNNTFAANIVLSKLLRVPI